MRDQRLIHRYGSAILSGDAQGFHTLVYGLILSLYSLPLRQGMLHYAYNTMRGFIHCAAGPLQLQPPTSESLLAEAFAAVPPALEILLEANGERSLQL